MTKKMWPNAPLGSGARFEGVKESVAEGYKEKGMSEGKAEKIGAAVAAKQGIKKYGAKKMSAMAKKGKKTA